MRKLFLFFYLLTAVWLWSATAVPSLAHERAEFGDYTLIVGWENEPVIVDERNAVILEVYRQGEPVSGLEGTLRLELLYAGRSFRGNLHPSGAPGHYRAEVVPTARGQYAVRLFGQIETLEIDEQIEPEEVLARRTLQFPEAQPDQREMLATITDLEAQAARANQLALAGLAAGLLGVGLAVFSLINGRRRKTTNDE
jgi:hypothetical protein